MSLLPMELLLIMRETNLLILPIEFLEHLANEENNNIHVENAICIDNKRHVNKP
jgi:hypothetical protein